MEEETTSDLNTSLKVMRSGLLQLAKKLDLPLNIEDQDYIIASTKGFFDDYTVGETLGEGCIGLVKRVIHKATQQHFAAKIVATTDEEIIRNVLFNIKKNLSIDDNRI